MNASLNQTQVSSLDHGGGKEDGTQQQFYKARISEQKQRDNGRAKDIFWGFF
jgi:hypothetical protein